MTLLKEIHFIKYLLIEYMLGTVLRAEVTEMNETWILSSRMWLSVEVDV